MIGVAVAGIATVRGTGTAPEADATRFDVVDEAPLPDVTTEGLPAPSPSGTSTDTRSPTSPVSSSGSPTARRRTGPPTPTTTAHGTGAGHQAVNEPEDAPPATALDQPAPLAVPATRVLYPGQSVVNGPTALTMDSRGDLTVTLRGAVTWSSGTAGRGVRTVFQDDGNFVVYAADNGTAWSSRTDGHHGAVLVITGSGEVYIRYQGAKLWQA